MPSGTFGRRLATNAHVEHMQVRKVIRWIEGDDPLKTAGSHILAAAKPELRGVGGQLFEHVIVIRALRESEERIDI